MNIPKHSQRSLLQFTKEVSDALLLVGKPKDRAVGQPKKSSISPTSKVGRASVEACASCVMIM